MDDNVAGGLVLCRKVSAVQKTDADIRIRLSERGFTAEKNFCDIIGRSPALATAVEKARQYDSTDFSVLILGESGTGKEIFAQSIHNGGTRRHGPFVAVNCAALPADLLESELFGYEPWAFTGANAKGRQGLLELAHGGTLFLDEIGEMPLVLQGKLLRVLQERKMMRLGAFRMLPVDIRIITATNKNLLKLVHSGNFRQDLYYRLNVLKLRLPPLRDRHEDISLLIANYFKNLDGRPMFATNAPDAMKKYDWPGNVREFYNIMERLVATHQHGHKIDEKDVNELLADERGDFEDDTVSSAEQGGAEQKNADLAEIMRVLAITNGNYTKAAQMLGISRITLWRKLKKAGKSGKRG